MKRLLATLRCDFTIQFRNGFFYVGTLLTVIWIALLRQVPFGDVDVGTLIPAMLVQHLLVTTFYFVGGLALLEKSEGTLAGLVVTPLHSAEYLLAKVLSLTLLAVTESMLIILAVYGARFWLLPLLGGMLLLGSFYTLYGFVAVARYDSLNEYLLPSIIVVALLMLPLAGYFGIWDSPLLYAHPVQPMLTLLHAAFVPATPWEIAYGIVGALGWLAASFALAQQQFHRFVVRPAGG